MIFFEAKIIWYISFNLTVIVLGHLLPPKKMTTILFLRDVLRGHENLLRVSQAQAIRKVPRFQEIDVRKFSSEIKLDERFSSFFPDLFVKRKLCPWSHLFFTVCEKIFALILREEFMKIPELVCARGMIQTTEIKRLKQELTDLMNLHQKQNTAEAVDQQDQVLDSQLSVLKKKTSERKQRIKKIYQSFLWRN